MSEVILLVSKQCGSCHAVRERLRQTGKAHRVREVDVDSPEGAELAKALNVRAVPECVMVARDGGGQRVARVCTDAEMVEILK